MARLATFKYDKQLLVAKLKDSMYRYDTGRAAAINQHAKAISEWQKNVEEILADRMRNIDFMVQLGKNDPSVNFGSLGFPRMDDRYRGADRVMDAFSQAIVRAELLTADKDGQVRIHSDDAIWRMLVLNENLPK